MSVITNYARVTNAVVVTNYVVVTNLTFTTNYFNAQGQLLVPIQGAMPLVAAPAASKPAAPDPAVVRSKQVQAIRDLLMQGLTLSSNALGVEGSFTANPNNQIRIPEGVTVLDRKKGQALTQAMNVAAEKAAPAAFTVLQKAAAQVNPADPQKVLQEGNDAATKFLVSSEGQNIANQILALVQKTAADARVSEAYNSVMLRGGGLLGAVLGTAPSVDMNAHITKGLMEAIFLNLSSQENLIRTDPAARKTKTLKDAFSK